MTAALRRIELDPDPGLPPVRREPSPAVRRKPSLHLASCNPNHRHTTNTYAGQGCPNAAGAGGARAANPSGPTSTRPHAPVKITGRTYSHDPNGNQTGWTHDTNGTNRTLTCQEEKGSGLALTHPPCSG